MRALNLSKTRGFVVDKEQADSSGNEQLGYFDKSGDYASIVHTGKGPEKGVCICLFFVDIVACY